MVKLGNLALDGSKFRAHASRYKAMSYGYMKKEVERLRAEVAALLQQAEQVDAAQDAMLGKSPRGRTARGAEATSGAVAGHRSGHAPSWNKRPKTRLRSSGVSVPRPKPNGKPPGSKASGRPPKEIAQHARRSERKPTSRHPEAKIMKVSNKGFDYCFNAQAMVDGSPPKSSSPLRRVTRPMTRNRPCPWPTPPWRTWRRPASSGL